MRPCAGSTQQHWPFPDSHVDLGYAYLFTHPGNPTIFWDHYFDNGYKVRSSQLRHSADQNCILHSIPSCVRGPAMQLLTSTRVAAVYQPAEGSLLQSTGALSSQRMRHSEKHSWVNYDPLLAACVLRAALQATRTGPCSDEVILLASCC